jgi:hypothetical protein
LLCRSSTATTSSSTGLGWFCGRPTPAASPPCLRRGSTWCATSSGEARLRAPLPLLQGRRGAKLLLRRSSLHSTGPRR